MTTHLSGDDGKTALCGYRPPGDWRDDRDNQWTGDEAQVTCPNCANVLNGEGGA